MNPEFEQLKLDVIELQNKLKQFESVAQMNPQYVRTITGVLLSPSAKSSTSENVAVNEGGAATYSVLGVPDGFTKIGDLNIPYYN